MRRRVVAVAEGRAKLDVPPRLLFGGEGVFLTAGCSKARGTQAGAVGERPDSRGVVTMGIKRGGGDGGGVVAVLCRLVVTLAGLAGLRPGGGGGGGVTVLCRGVKGGGLALRMYCRAGLLLLAAVEPVAGADLL